jgi:hypothetical protein
MSATYTDAPEVRAIAEELIRDYHQHIADFRVRVVYLYSDQEPETRGKRIYGDLKIITNLNAHIAEKPEEEEYELPSFVCCKCRGWKVEGERTTFELNSDFFDFCTVCFDEVSTWEFDGNNANIAKIMDWRDRAKMKQDGGFSSGETTAFFVMVVYKTYFDQAPENRKRFIVNHLLCHAGVTSDKNGNTKLFKKPHDFEGFLMDLTLFGPDVIGDLQRMGKAVLDAKDDPQLKLIDNDDWDKNDESDGPAAEVEIEKREPVAAAA